MVSCAEYGRDRRTLVYFSEAVFFDPFCAACTPLEGPEPPSDDISSSDPALASLSTRAAFFAAFGFATGFLTVCFVVTFTAPFFALNRNASEPVNLKPRR